MMTPQAITSLLHQSLQVSWDSYAHPGAGLDELDYNRIEGFIEEVNSSIRNAMVHRDYSDPSERRN
jgi:predicted HTH transcriptional regulator